MMHISPRRKLAICGLTILTGMAIGQAVWPDIAHADESSYITGVSSRGVEIDRYTLPIGYHICADISDNGTAGIDNESRYAATAGVSTHDASVIVVEAVYQLCPSNLPALKAYLSSDDG